MKKIVLITLATFLGLVIILVAIPFLFKDKIKARVLADIDSRIDADVYFGDMSLSSLRNFPRMSLDLDDFYIMGKEKFAGDTLAYVKTVSVSFDFYSVINDNHKIEIRSIRLIEPKVHIRVAKDGTSNYNIYKTDSAASGSSSFNIAIDHWVIRKGSIIYDDLQQNTYLELADVNHSGNGDFTQEVSDLNLATSVASISYSLNGVKYLDRKKLTTDLNMEMNLKDYKFTFKDHVFDINHFKFGFEGYFKFLKQGYEIDMRVLANRSDFRDLLSLLPGFYIDDFERMKVTGDFTLDAHVKGVYDVTTKAIPNFSLELIVKNGAFKYDHLPKGADHINLDLRLDNNTGVTGESTIDLRSFHMLIDGVPIRGRFKMQGVGRGSIDADIVAKIDLAEIEKMYPMDSLTIKGKLSADIKAKGNFDRARNTFPVIDAELVLSGGYIKSLAWPVAMEQIEISAEATNTSGNLSDTHLELHKMTWLLDGEPFEMKGSIRDMNNYAYDLTVDGLIDLGKLSTLYPMAHTSVTGTLDIDIETSGKLSTLQAMNFDSLKSSGTIEFKDVMVSSGDMTQPLKISDAKLNFNPQKIVVERFTGSSGRSDFSLTGHLYDYHSWVFSTGRNIRADLTLLSDTLDINQLFPSAPADTATHPPSTVSLPPQIDFTFDAKAGYVLFDQMKILNLAGEVRIKNGSLNMNQINFTSEDAAFELNGSYNAVDPKHPAFDMIIDIQKLDINKAFAMFETVKNAAPGAQNTDGIFSTKYHLKGELSPDFSPIMQTLIGNGTIVIEDAQVKGMKIFNSVGSMTKKQELTDPHIKDISMETEIKGGKVYIKPFSFQIGKYFTELEGTQGFDNNMNYILKLSVPAFKKIKIPFHISGTVDKPIVKLGKGHEKFDFSDF